MGIKCHSILKNAPTPDLILVNFLILVLLARQPNSFASKCMGSVSRVESFLPGVETQVYQKVGFYLQFWTLPVQK